MGLLTNYVSYRLGRRRERSEWKEYAAQEELSPKDDKCIFFSDLCTPRGSCPRDTTYQCVYDE